MAKRPLKNTAIKPTRKSPPNRLNLSEIPPIYHDFILKLTSDFPDFTFKTGKKFAFRPPKTIFLGPPQPNYALQTLHELAHALCGHKDYTTSVSRLKLEREAWERARSLFKTYRNLSPDSWGEDFVEDSLDTYRDWLHQKTLCKTCGLTCFESDDGTLHCPRCENFA